MPNFIVTVPLETIIFALVFGIIVSGFFVIFFTNLFKQARCKHAVGVNETSACEGICKQCGKNLGWIGNYRGDN